jgi:RNase adaptor protein for sRNA GlmZ degradation
VRLSNRKIEHLGKRVLKMMQDDPRIHPAGNTDLVLRAIEDDQEVEQLLAQNLNEIRAMEMDVGALRAKMKRELARKKRFVL